ncbi:MAG: hypothetical protein ABI602_02995 [Candidatus Saccharibacteria bacterium]
MSTRNSEQTNNSNHVLSDFLMSISQHALAARRVEQLDGISGRYRERLDNLIDAHDEDFSQWQDQWPVNLVQSLARCAVKGRQAEVEASQLRQLSFFYDRGLKILEQIPNWAGTIIVAASISGDPIIQRSTYQKRGADYNRYTNDDSLATAQGILRSDSILDTDNTTLLLRTAENVFRRRRFGVPLLNPDTLEPQVTLRVADSH